MSQKRKLDEFHDPNYFNDTVQKNLKFPKLSLSSLPKKVSPIKKNNNNNTTAKERIEKIKNIIHKEFLKELELKEQEIIKIQDNILLTKKLLRRVRYAIVLDYYNKKALNTELSAESTINTNDGTYIPFDNGISTFFGTAIGDKYRQNAIHPAIKNVINTKEIDYDNLLRIRPVREAAKTAKTTISEKLRTKKEEKKLQREAAANALTSSSSPLSLLSSIIATGGSKRKNRIENNIVLDAEGNPVYYNDNKLNKDDINCNLSSIDTNVVKSTNSIDNSKKVEQLNTFRGQNQIKHLIVVGNTSKYVGDEKSTDGATHKWLIYVQTRTQTKIEKLLNKVRFFLHPSYRPNDIVDICNPPFQLVKRGWGEFPVRIQLFFREYLQQKPVKIVHNLVLDKTLSGLQTMGAETLVEIWLRSYDVKSSVPITRTTSTSQQESTLTTKNLQLINENIFNDLIKKESKNNSGQFNEIKIKKEIEENSDNTTNNENNNTTLQNEMIPENIFEFLNKIETQNPPVCHESEKIEPTIIDSPIIDNNNFKKQLPINNSNAIKNLNTIQSSLEESSISSLQKQRHENKISNQNINSEDKKPSVISLNYVIDDNNVKIKTEPNNDISYDNTFNSLNNNNTNKIVTSTTINTINVNNLTTSRAIIPPILNNANVYQKRFVKCVDKDGNTKIVQMLIKQNPKPLSVINLKNGQIQHLSMSNENKQNGNVSQPILKAATGITTVKMIPKCNTVPVTQINEILSSSTLSLAQISMKPNSTYTSASITTSSKNYQNKNKSNTLNLQYIPPTIATRLNICKTKLPLQNMRITNLHQHQQQQKQSLNNSTINSTNHQVYFKDGKMFIVDPMQLKLKQQNKKQESLLKPQVSLLKPTVKNDNFMNCIRNELKNYNTSKHTVIATDHDYTSLSGKSNIIKSSLPSSSLPLYANIDNSNADRQQMLNNRNSSQNALIKIEKYQNDNDLNINLKSNYENEFCNKFLKIQFINVRHAVEYLLRKLPIINKLAEDINYKMEFPFIISNENAVNKMILPKRKAIEWLHAKYISQLLNKHPKINIMKLWTTKEIILFARKHAFTPVIMYSDSNSNEIKIKHNSNNNNFNGKDLNSVDSFKELIKNEIKKEKIKHQTVTSSNKISKWVTNVMKIKNNFSVNLDFNNDDDDEIIVDINDNGNNDKIKNNKRNEECKNQLYTKNVIPIDGKYKNESYLINETCNKIGICLEPEEIFPDVFHHSAHIIFSVSLRLFIEDLIRRTISEKVDISHTIVESLINVDDIKRTILSKTQFDFLTNKHLGISSNQITKNNNEFG